MGSADERAAWASARDAYAGLAKPDPVFDATLVAINDALNDLVAGGAGFAFSRLG